MNYLELCQELAREAGISGSIAAVTGQTGEMARVANWIRKANRYILNKHEDWKFLRADVSFPVILGNVEYSAGALSLADFGEWKLDSFRAYLTSIGFADEQPVREVRDYDAFRDYYIIGALREQEGRPQAITQTPGRSLRIWPVPDDAYTIVGEYYQAPADLAANADVPVFPAKFHDAIVWRALMFYGEYEGDATVFAAAQTEFKRVLAKLESLYLPSIEAGGPMA